MIRITMINNNVITWHENEYTDYECADGWFYIILKEAYIGYYNMSCVASIEVSKEHEENIKQDVEEDFPFQVTEK